MTNIEFKEQLQELLNKRFEQDYSDIFLKPNYSGESLNEHESLPCGYSLYTLYLNSCNIWNICGRYKVNDYYKQECQQERLRFLMDCEQCDNVLEFIMRNIDVDIPVTG